MFCYRCGKQIPDNVKFCIYCGTNLEGKKPAPGPQPAPAPAPQPAPAPRPQPQPAPGPMPYPEPQPAPDRKSKKWILPLVIILVLLLVLGGGIAAGILLMPGGVDGLKDSFTDLASLLPGRSGEEDDEEDDDRKKYKDDEESDEEDSGSEDEENGKELPYEEDAPANQRFAESQAAAPAAEEAPKSVYLELLSDGTFSSRAGYFLTDLNGDNRPELFGKTDISDAEAGYKIFTETPDGIDMLDLSDGTTAFAPDANMILHTRTEDTSAYDKIYRVGADGFEVVFEGSVEQDSYEPYLSNGDPNMICYADGTKTDEKTYYEDLERLFYLNQVNAANGQLLLGKDDMEEILSDADPLMAYHTTTASMAYAVTTDWEFSYEQKPQFFTAPQGGTYEFFLCGANGGADNNRDYDYEGGTLTGTIELKAGERVLILTGGAGGITKDYYDVKRKQDVIVPGGFNGGGKALNSGGGGGCTDIYYNGRRIAAAAGSGGGNYEDEGHAGRKSDFNGNFMRDKNGEDSPKTDGGGGGGGWFGGHAGIKDHSGNGGKTGWDKMYFQMSEETEGQAFTRTGSRNGSVRVTLVD
ncbi:MAG: zinc-ribbon domain-containing protein [Lachnospiraceae bacterium]|nr:zinc-ribbon domain-containing protein [Lachnospiraceae bacterium]